MIKPSGKLLAKFLLPYLSWPEFLNLSQRKMAGLSGISNGGVSNIQRYLQAKELSLPLRDRIKVINRTGLIDLWDSSFQEGLLPKLSKRRFRFQRPQEYSDNNEVILSSACWGGQTAALHYGLNFKRTEDEVIYCDYGEPLRELIIQLRLIPDSNGPLEVRERFWHFDPNNNFAPKFLVYSDLRASKDMRLSQLAEQLLQ